MTKIWFEVSENGPRWLARQELEIVALVTQGFTDREIAEMLFLSEPAVASRLVSIFEKLRVSDRLELALYATARSWTATAGP